VRDESGRGHLGSLRLLVSFHELISGTHDTNNRLGEARNLNDSESRQETDLRRTEGGSRGDDQLPRAVECEEDTKAEGRT
jgi:hypothetical protein